MNRPHSKYVLFVLVILTIAYGLSSPVPITATAAGSAPTLAGLAAKRATAEAGDGGSAADIAGLGFE